MGERLKGYMAARPSQQAGTPYRERDGAVSIDLSPAGTVSLSAGKHNQLVKDICDKFASRFMRKRVPVYVGDTAKKFAYFDVDLLSELGVSVNPHGKMPDVILYDTGREWIFVIEAVTSHGPVDAKRRRELQEMFSGAKAGIVYVTAFADRDTMRKYAADISWETEVWVADEPDHMIHFNGDGFKGPQSRHKSQHNN